MFHKEGYKVILITTIAIGLTFILIDKFVTDALFNRGISFLILIIYLFILQQYRNSKRIITQNDRALFTPVDGILKSIEKSPKSLSEQDLLLTFYVSPFKFHSIKAPFEGIITENFSKDMPGSSLKIKIIEIQNKEHNLHTRIEISPAKFSQNATLYSEKNSFVKQGEEIGFVNFDAKVRLTLKHDSKLDVNINDNVKAGIHKIATI